MVRDYAEELLQTIGLIVEDRVGNLSFDKTEICTIVDDSQKKNGRYSVSNGSARYDAFVNSADEKYKVKDSVRVSIPNGDYSQKKYIQGLNTEDDNINPITYVSPLDTILDMTDSIIPNQGNMVYGLRANDLNQTEVCLWSADCTQASYKHLQNNEIYDAILMKADFKTLMSGYNVTHGSYGLRLDMYFKPTSGVDKLIKYSAYLDTADMFGNPYSFSVYSMQARKFSIKDMGTIHTMSLYFYQKNNFTYLTDEGAFLVLPVLNAQDPDYSNILLKNLYLSFGSDIVNINDNTLKLYTNDSLDYDRLATDTTTNTKGLGLLWYNKNDNGQYVGFSDGIADPPPKQAHETAQKTYYDEIEYLQLSEQDSRLLGQQGKDVPTDEKGLKLSADIVDAEKISQKLRNAITYDLYNCLNSFQSRISAVCAAEAEAAREEEKEDSLGKAFEELLNNSDTTTYSKTISLIAKELEQREKDLVAYYEKNLSWARKKQDKKEYTRKTDLAYTKPYTMMLTVKNPDNTSAKTIISLTQSLLNTSKTIISERYGGFVSVWDSFNIRLTKILDNIDKLRAEFLTIMGSTKTAEANETALNNFFNNSYTFTQYKTIIEPEDFHNRYCIYWYRYEPGYKDENERFMPKEWRRLTEKQDFDCLVTKDSTEGKTIVRNFGLPSDTEAKYVDDDEEDVVNYYIKRPDVGEGILTRVLDADHTEKEKYCVILFYNHVMYKSNELEFTNLNPPQDEDSSDQGDALYISHGPNSCDTYQIYGINNGLLNARDGYLTRELEVHYEGVNGGDEKLIDGQVFWYLPNKATMLKYDLNDYGTNFTNDIYDKVDSPNKMTGYTCFYRTIKGTVTQDEEGKNVVNMGDSLKFQYRIKDYYSQNSTNNNIICKVITKDKRTLETSILLTFCSYGTSGTDYTLVVAPATSQAAITENETAENAGDTIEKNYFAYKIELRDYNNELVDIIEEEMNPEISFIGPTNTPYNVSPITSGEEGEAKLTGCKVWIPYSENNSDGVLQPQKGHYYGILQVTIDKFTIPEEKDEDEKVLKKSREIKLTSFAPVCFSSKDSLYQGQTMVECPSVIVYDSTGGNPTYYKDPCAIFSNNVNKNKDEEITDVEWSMIYYKDDGTLYKATNKEEREKYKLTLSYMPTFQENKLIPSNMYLDTSESKETDLYPVLCCKAKTGGHVLWAQPILLLQNRYPSAMINEWDGQFIVDEEAGTIMSTMVGAGRKNSNNTFDGVLMGDVAVGTESNIGLDDLSNYCSAQQNGLGIYGFNDGQQSFGFSVTGSAFIGKSGQGRIVFNGNRGFIASETWFTGAKNAAGNLIYPSLPEPQINDNGIVQPSTAGMCIDLKNGHIDAYDYKLTSKNIYLNSNPKDADEELDYYMRIGGDGELAYPGQISQDRTKGFLGLTNSGELQIKVNSLHITEQFGGENLLNQTFPSKTATQQKLKDGAVVAGEYETTNSGRLKFYWDVDTRNKNPKTSQWVFNNSEESGYAPDTDGYIVGTNKIYSGTTKEEEATCIRVQRQEKSATLSQTVTYQIVAGQPYTLSGLVRRANATETSKKTFTISVSNAKKDPMSDKVKKENYTEENDSSSFTVSITNEDWTKFEYNMILNEKDSSNKTISEVTITFYCPADFYLYQTKFEQGTVATEWTQSKWDTAQGLDTNLNNYERYLTQDAIFDGLIRNPATGEDMNGIWLVDGTNSSSGKTELYISATYMASGILRSNNFDGTITCEEMTSSEKEAYYKQLYGNNYKDKLSKDLIFPTYKYTLGTPPTQGIYFNLNEGKMWGAKFELDAWNDTNDNGLYLNSHPDTDDYFRIGDSSNNISFSGGGVLDINASKFKLSAGSGDNYLGLFSADQDDGVTIGSGENITTWRIIAGTKFGVTSAGKLYASGASISGTLTAGAGSKIGGWTIYADRIEGGNLKLFNTGEIKNTSNNFGVTSAGILSATGANLTNLTITGTFSLTPTGNANLTGDIIINGKCTIGSATQSATDAKKLYVAADTQVSGNLYMGTTGASRIYANAKTDNCIYFDANQIYVAGPLVSLAATTIHLGKTADGNSPDTSNTYAKGNLYFGGTIYAHNGSEYVKGVDGEFKVETGWFKTGKLVFKKGILIDVTDKNGNSTTGNAGVVQEATFTLPSSKGTKGQVLKSNGDGTSYWGEDIDTDTDTNTQGGFYYSTNADGVVNKISGSWFSGGTYVSC